ncbi:tetratricopeptide repeat protein [Calycomorphotria hydatis]|uniref:tetratricopeptide repeat protein n=1 Tax=Calycomorphotria hydatis TaxID=2528027 RepID=UPI001E5F7D55|nr:tetratricopeptide repeat protein [Calycomorphotria hydatis]
MNSSFQRTHSVLVLSAALVCATSIGCASSGGKGFAFFKGNKQNPQQVAEAKLKAELPVLPGSRKDLKNPARLDLSYARWQQEMGNFPEARKAYQRALDEEPNSLPAMLGLARMEELASRNLAAEEAYKNALAKAPTDPDALHAVGQYYARTERWSDAITHLNKAMQADPDSKRYRFDLGIALAKSGHPDRAYPHLAGTVGPAEAHYNLGYLFYEAKQYEAAEREFLTAVAQKPDLEAAVAMVDEIRREREDATLLATRPQQQQTIQAAAQNVPARQPVYQAGAFQQTAMPQTPQPQQQVRDFHTTTRLQPAPPVPSSWQPVPQQNVMPVQQPVHYGTPSSAHPNMTPAQIEQLQNQRLSR